MPTTTNKQRILTQLLSTLPRHMDVCGGGDSKTAPRPVLEEFIYALCREGTTSELADRAYDNLRSSFFDWNEIRVSSSREVADALEMLPHCEQRAQRIVGFLQQVFDSTFSFDLEHLHKKGVKEAARKLARYQVANDFVISWVIQHSLGGHALPLDGPMLRTLRRLGVLDGDQTDAETGRSGLEHQVPKAKGSLFVEVLSRLAEEYCWESDPRCDHCPLGHSCPSASKSESIQARPKPR